MTAPTPRRKRQPKAPASSLYKPLSWAVLRAPLLPVESYHQIVAGGPKERRLFLDDDRVRTALAVGSPDLLDAVERSSAGKERDRQDSSLLRYLIRMSSRPTPYGLFAGVGLARWGEQTTTLLAGPPFTRSRPDMGWLIELLASAAAEPQIRERLRVSANRAVAIRGGRVFVLDRTMSTSVRATAAVRQVLRLAAEPIRYDELVTALLGMAGATQLKVITMLDELLRQSVLFTELRPSLVTSNPARRALHIMQGIPAAQHRAAALEAFLDDVSRFDQAIPAEASAAYRALIDQGKALQPGIASPVQVDLVWPLSGAIGARVGDAAARAVEILLSLSPAPAGPPALQGYKQAFAGRYGHQRQVPILELLDPGVGIGPLGGGSHGGIPPERAGRRSRRLLALAVEALRDRQTMVDLTEADIDDLRTGDLDEHSLPLSLELSLFVLAGSINDIDAGRFQLVVGPNLGAPAAGRNLGRFASVLGPEAVAALREVAGHESRLMPNRAFAEVAYIPSRARSANVAVRPATRPFQIVSALAAEAEGIDIPLDELSIGLDGNRLRVIWSRDGTEVIPCAGHMLNTRGAPAAVALLDEIAGDGSAQIGLFDWGPANLLPVLPRVSYRELVLRPAQWALDRNALRLAPEDRALDRFDKRFEDWRERWSVPRLVYLAFGDNRLLLDLDQLDNRAEVRRELALLPPGGSLILHEPLPGPEHAWLTGPAGRYICELVVPLIRRSEAALGSPAFSEVHVAPDPGRAPPVSAGSRVKLPGSEWLYAKLYGSVDIEDDLLTGPVREFTDLALLTGAAESWFFLRYADPAPHLRIRFRGDPERLTDTLLPRLFSWAAELQKKQLSTTLVVDTYEREIERYGGTRGLEVAEAIHSADSRAIPELLDASSSPADDIDRLCIAVLSIDDLLGSLGLDIPERTRWLGAQVHNRRASGAEYRARGNRLRDLLGVQSSLAALAGGERVVATLAERRQAIVPLGAELAALESAARLTTSRDNVMRDLVHLHCNRLLGRNAVEDLPLGLLLRTWQGLQHR